MSTTAARRADAVLRERARVLAQPEASLDPVATVEVTTFVIGGHAIGLPTQWTLRAAPLRHVVEIPGGPPYLGGVTAIDGHLVSLLDLATFCNLGRRGVSDITACLLASCRGRDIGLAAEQLLGIEDVPSDRIAPLPGSASALHKVARLDGQDVMLLDLEALFADERLTKLRHG